MKRLGTVLATVAVAMGAAFGCSRSGSGRTPPAGMEDRDLSSFHLPVRIFLPTGTDVEAREGGGIEAAHAFGSGPARYGVQVSAPEEGTTEVSWWRSGTVLREEARADGWLITYRDAGGPHAARYLRSANLICQGYGLVPTDADLQKVVASCESMASR